MLNQLKKNFSKKTKESNPDLNVLSLRPKVWKIEISKEKVGQYFSFHKKPISIVLVIIVSLVLSSSWFRSAASVANFYTTSCLGGWENVHLAEGEPQANQKDLDSFAKSNSAVLENSSAEMLCGKFLGEIPESGTPTKFTVKLSMLVDKKDNIRNTPVIDSLPNENIGEIKVTEDNLIIGDGEVINLDNQSDAPSEITGNSETETGGVEVIEIPVETESGNSTEVVVPKDTTPEPVVEEPTPVVEETPAEEVLSLFRRVFSKGKARAQEETPAPEPAPESAPEPETVEETTPEPVVEEVELVEPVVEETPAPSEPTVVEVPAEEEKEVIDVVEVKDENSGEIVVDEETVVDTIIETTNPIGESSGGEVRSNTDYLEVFYTIDGIDWKSIGVVHEKNWQDASFELPGEYFTDWKDLDNLQIKLEPINSFDEKPVILIDSVWVEVSYEEDVIDAPKILIENPEGIIEGEQYFTPSQGPEFIITKIKFSDAELVDLVDKKKAKILEDKAGYFTKKVENRQAQSEISKEHTDLVEGDSENDSVLKKATKFIGNIFGGKKEKTEEDVVENIPQEDVVEEVAPEPEKIEVIGSESDKENIIQENTTGDIIEVLPDSIEVQPEVQGDNTAGGEPSGTEPDPNILGSVLNFFGINRARAQDIVEPIIEPTVEPTVDPVVDPVSDPTIEPTVDPANNPVVDTEPVIVPVEEPVIDPIVEPIIEEAPADVEIPDNIKLSVIDSDGVKADISTTLEAVLIDGEVQYKVKVGKPGRQFKVGKYKLVIEIDDNGNDIVIQQDFTWGVLTINTDKSIYKPGDTAHLFFGVLDETGSTLCDAGLDLKLILPDGTSSIFSTENNTIVQSGACDGNNVTNLPDYSSVFQIPNQEGIVKIELTAVTANGPKKVVDEFLIKSDVKAEILRSGPTRIYPPADYPMTLTITANKDFNGKVFEYVPVGFQISTLPGVKEYETVYTEGDTKVIRWDLELKEGKSVKLGYTFDAPDISPEMFLLGEAKLLNNYDQLIFKEIRQWQIASDAVASNGVIFYGDTTNAGKLKIITFTNPSTYGSEINVNLGSAINIMHVIGVTAPTREEMMVGYLSGNPTTNGRLDIVTCTNGCDAAVDYTLRWTATSVSGTQDCDSSPTIGTCTQPYDVAYGALSGLGIVVYAGDADANSTTDTDKIYYAFWNGSAWSPDTTPNTPSATNELDLPGTGGTPKWIRVIPVGQGLANTRSSRAIVLVADSDDDLYAFYWDGSTFDSGTEIYTTLGNCDRNRCFDGNWQGNNNFLVSYTNSGSSEIRYQQYTVGSGWGSDTQVYTTAATPAFVKSAASPTSSRIIQGSNTTANDTRSAVWRDDDASDGWTVCASGSCPDTNAEADGGPQMAVAFERLSGQALHVYNDAANGTTQGNKYMTYNPTATWGTSAVTGITPTDDHQSTRIFPSPNGNEIMIIAADVDCDVDAIMWNGSGFGTVLSNFELLLSSSNGSCANSVPISGMAVTGGYDFSWKMYSPWGLNWRWTGDTSTATPGSWLAAENTTPTGVTATGYTMRLRYGFVNRGVVAQTLSAEGRKKLQYTASTTPDDPDTTWTDVDADGGGGIWRYDNCSAGTDDGAIPSAQLTAPSGGTNTVGDFIEATGNITMNHNAGPAVAVENDYCIESNGAAASTTYYFRAYDEQQLTPVFREQDDDGNNDCASATCTYPSVTTASSGISISGTVYTSAAEATPYNCSTGNLNLRVSVNGGANINGTCTASDGTFTISGVTAPGSADVPIVVFVDSADATNKTTTVTMSADGSSDITGLSLMIDRTLVTSQSATNMTNAKMATGDNGDAGIRYSVSSGNLTVESGMELHVLAGKTFVPGGNVTTTSTATTAGTAGDVHIPSTATLNMGTNALSVGGDLTNAGTLTLSATQTITMTATGTGFTLTHGGTTLQNLIFNGSGGGWVFSGTTTITGDLTVTAGTLSGTNDITVNGGDITGDGTITRSAGTVTINTAGNFGGNTAWTFYNLTIGAAGNATTTATGTGGITVTNLLTIDTGDTLDAKGKTWTLSGTSGTVFTISGTLNDSTDTSTFNFTGANGGGDTTIPTSTGYHNITTNASDTFNISGTSTLTGTLTITTGTVVVANFITLTTAFVNIGASGVLTSGTNTNFTLNGSSGTLWTNAGTFNESTSVVNFKSTSSVTLLSGTTNFYSVYMNPTLTGSIVYTVGTAITIPTGPGVIFQPTAGSAFSLTVNMSAAWTISATISTVNITGLSSATAILNTGSNYAITVGKMTIGAGGTLTANNSTITLTGNTTTILTYAGTFTPGGSTVIFNGNASITTVSAAITFWNVTFSPLNSGTRTYTLPSGFDVDNNFTISPTGSGTFSTALASAIVIDGSFSVSATGATATFSTGTNYSFSSAGFSVGSGGTFNANNSALTITGNFANSGTFTAGGSTVTLSGASQQTLSGTMTSTSSFYNLTITNNSGSNASDDELTGFSASVVFGAALTATNNFVITTASVRVQYTSGATYTFNNINWNGGAVGTRIFFRNSTAGSGTWLLNVSGTQTAVSYVNVSRSNAGSGNTIVASDGTNYDGSNNTNWNFVLSIDVSGTAFANDTTTALGTVEVNLRVNGTLAGTGDGGTGIDNTSSGVFAFTGITASAGDTITLTINGAAENANTIIITDGTTTLTSIPLYDNHVVVRSEHGATAITIADMVDWDLDQEADGDLIFDAEAGSLVLSDGAKLFITSADTFTPGGTITTSPSNDGTDSVVDGDIEIDGTGIMTMGTNALSVGGDFLNEGTFNKSTGQTTTFTATATGHSITDGGENFDTLVFNGSGGGWSIADGITVDVNMTVTAGTFDPATFLVTGNGTNVLTVSNGATLDVDASTFGGNYTSFETITLATGSTVDYNLGGTQTVDSTLSYSNLDISTSGTKTLDGTTTATGTMTITGSTLDTDSGNNYTLNTAYLDIATGGTLTANNSTINLTATSGTLFTLTGTFTAGGSTVDLVGDGSATITTDAIVFNNLTSSGTGTKTLGSGITINDTLSLTDGIFYPTSFQVAGSGTNTWHVGNGAEAQVETAGIGANYNSFETITLDTGSTINYMAAGAQTVGAGVAYSNLKISTSGTKTLQNNTTATGTTTINGATLDTGTNRTLNTAYLDIATGGTLTANNSAINITGTSGTLFTRVGTFTAGGSTVSLTGAGSATINSGTITFYSLTSSNTGTKTLGGAILVEKTFTVSDGIFNPTADYSADGNSLGVLVVSGTGNIYVETPTFVGNYGHFVSHTFSGTSTVEYMAGGAQTVADTATLGDNYINLVISQSGTKTLNEAVDTDSDVTINNTAILDTGTDLNLGVGGSVDITASAELSIHNSTISIARNFTKSGTFSIDGSSTVAFNSTGDTNITGTITFDNLTIAPGAAKNTYFSTTHTVTINGAFTVTGAVASLVKLWSHTGGTPDPGVQWNINHQGTESVDYADVKDGGCDGASTTITTTNSTNSLNNDSCWQFGSPELTFSLGSNAINLGTLTTGGTGTGSHTFSAATNATGGFAVYVNGATLSTGLGPTISAIGATPATSATNTEQFGINVADNNGTPTIGDPIVTNSGTCGAGTGFGTADNYKFVAGSDNTLTAVTAAADCVYTTSYIGNIDGVTEAGAYSTTLTYTIVGTF